MTPRRTRANAIDTPRLRLDPMGPADADELFAVLDDVALHLHTGGEPMSRPELERWITFVASGASPSGWETWCNWVIRRTGDNVLVGTGQATIVDDEASLAWVIGTAWQGSGYAKEAAAGMVAWLRAHGVSSLRANIHPDHGASKAVARSIGLTPTDEREAGEVVWRST